MWNLPVSYFQLVPCIFMSDLPGSPENDQLLGCLVP